MSYDSVFKGLPCYLASIVSHKPAVTADSWSCWTNRNSDKLVFLLQVMNWNMLRESDSLNYVCICLNVTATWVRCHWTDWIKGCSSKALVADRASQRWDRWDRGPRQFWQPLLTSQLK